MAGMWEPRAGEKRMKLRLLARAQVWSCPSSTQGAWGVGGEFGSEDIEFEGPVSPTWSCPAKLCIQNREQK